MAKPNPSGGPTLSLTAVKGRPLPMALPPAERRNLIRRASIVRRIAAEFQEMPGLVLTTRQASRLLGVDDAACARILAALVDEGVLRRRGRDSFGRNDNVA